MDVIDIRNIMLIQSNANKPIFVIKTILADI